MIQKNFRSLQCPAKNVGQMEMGVYEEGAPLQRPATGHESTHSAQHALGCILLKVAPFAQISPLHRFSILH